MQASIKVTGGKETADKFKRLQTAALKVLAKGVDEEVEVIMQEAQVEVPKDTGALHDSIRRGKTRVSKTQGVKVRVRAGGSKAPYGIYVHEDLTKHHAAPTKAKFLIDPFMRRSIGMGKRLAAKLNHTFKGVGFK